MPLNATESVGLTRLPPNTRTYCRTKNRRNPPFFHFFLQFFLCEKRCKPEPLWLVAFLTFVLCFNITLKHRVSKAFGVLKKAQNFQHSTQHRGNLIIIICYVINIYIYDENTHHRPLYLSYIYIFFYITLYKTAGSHSQQGFQCYLSTF